MTYHCIWHTVFVIGATIVIRFFLYHCLSFVSMLGYCIGCFKAPDCSLGICQYFLIHSLFMLMLSFIFVIACDFFEWKQIYRAGILSLFTYVLPLEIQLLRGVWVPLTNLTYHMVVSVPHKELDVIFVFSQLRSDVTVRFVDFGGIVDCLNFLK